MKLLKLKKITSYPDQNIPISCCCYYFYFKVPTTTKVPAIAEAIQDRVPSIYDPYELKFQVTCHNFKEAILHLSFLQCIVVLEGG